MLSARRCSAVILRCVHLATVLGRAQSTFRISSAIKMVKPIMGSGAGNIRGFTESAVAMGSSAHSGALPLVPMLDHFTFSAKLKDFTVCSEKPEDFDGEVVVLPFYSPVAEGADAKAAALLASIAEDIPAHMREFVEEAIKERIFSGDARGEFVFRLPNGAADKGAFDKCKYLALVGLGEAKTARQDSYLLGRQLTALSAQLKGAKVGLVPQGLSLDVAQLVHGICEAAYDDKRFRKIDANAELPVSITSVSVLEKSTQARADSITALATASGVKFARDLVGAPANAKTPVIIADIAKELARQHDLECNILGEKECVARGMGGYLSVQQGSKYPPQFIHMAYKPKSTENVKKIVLIGKGLTFDSGGYNLKVGAGSSIEMMKIDMGGLGAVLGCAKAIGQLRPENVEVHFVSAVCENMISANAIRPGDVVTASNGKTIEIVNTDAEGRLTLADALVYAQSIGDVDAIIDLATLTGACIVGLGDKVAGLYSSDKALLSGIMDAAEKTDEKVWPLPLEESYRSRIKSPIANIQNVGGNGGGGSITAALFLQEFVEKTTPWAHIDIAGPVWDDKQQKPTGFGVKMLVEYLSALGNVAK